MENIKVRKQKRKESVFTGEGNHNEEKFLDEVIAHVSSKLKSGKHQVKVAEALKAIELKEKIKSKGGKSKEKIFWELIDQIRKEELPE
ncbi:MAG TPA: hypothetical protein VMT04_04655 [Terriglobales bacterium]|nr:hypothetical protein [Terriglobales bacterium]